MDRKHQVLKQYFGYTEFRGGQEELIDAQLAGRDVFGIMPTGGGKSLCYQIPALMSDGITLVISPLISLMKDQVAALKRAGVAAAYINSSLSQNQIRTVYANLADGKYKIVYVAPERLMTESFLDVVQQLDISILAVDEAHCISQWGQDFRPNYLKIAEFIDTLERRPVVSAFTATATERVRDDVERALKLRKPLRVVTGFDRPNLSFQVLHPKNKPATLVELVKARSGKSGIVYCATRNLVEKMCTRLQENGIAATMYHAGLSDETRRDNQDDFIYDRCSVIVATNAFGMGIDKSNVSYVIHYNMPQSIEAYYQEAGRAGRDGSAAECILMFALGDIRTAKHLIEHSSRGDESPDARERQRIEKDLARLDKMIAYCKTTKCLRGYILSYFGEEHGESCGNCGNCGAQIVETDVTTQAQMILSCVKRVKDYLCYPVGITVIANTLHGSRDKRILELGLDSLSTYGLMKNTPRDDIRSLVEALVTEGYLYKNTAFDTVSTTERAKAVLFHGEKVTLSLKKDTTAPKGAKKAKRQSADPTSEDSLLSALKTLRFKIAFEEGVPQYVVFSNATLQDMAEIKPTNKEEFLTVSGVGKYKAEHYSAQFTDLIKRYVATHGE